VGRLLFEWPAGAGGDSWLEAAKSLAGSSGVAGPSAAQLAGCASCFAQDDSFMVGVKIAKRFA